MKSDDDSELKEFDEIRAIVTNSLVVEDTDDLPEGTRQILIVTSHHFISANYVESSASGKNFSRLVLELRGYSSPSSDPGLNHASIVFMDDSEKVHCPTYTRASGVIRLWMHYRDLPMVLAQMKESNVYCWIGHFAGGHIWGDIHTNS